MRRHWCQKGFTRSFPTKFSRCFKIELKIWVSTEQAGKFKKNIISAVSIFFNVYFLFPKKNLLTNITTFSLCVLTRIMNINVFITAWKGCGTSRDMGKAWKPGNWEKYYGNLLASTVTREVTNLLSAMLNISLPINLNYIPVKLFCDAGFSQRGEMRDQNPSP